MTRLLIWVVTSMQTYAGIVKVVGTVALITFVFHSIGCNTEWKFGKLGYMASVISLVVVVVLGVRSGVRLISGDMIAENQQMKNEITASLYGDMGYDAVNDAKSTIKEFDANGEYVDNFFDKALGELISVSTELN